MDSKIIVLMGYGGMSRDLGFSGWDGKVSLKLPFLIGYSSIHTTCPFNAAPTSKNGCVCIPSSVITSVITVTSLIFRKLSFSEVSFIISECSQGSLVFSLRSIILVRVVRRGEGVFMVLRR
jgi:hypothetical protein